MVDALGRGDIIDQATQQHPEMRDLTGGEAVNAMGLNGLGCINHARSLGPRVCQPQPTDRLMAPRVAPEPLNDDALGRAWDTLDASGVTARYRLLAATAAKRLDLRPTSRHLDRMSVHVDGRDHRDEPPAEPVVPIPKGSRRDHRPDLNHVMWEWSVEPQAGMPVLMQPLSGHRRDPPAFGQGIQAPIPP